MQLNASIGLWLSAIQGTETNQFIDKEEELFVSLICNTYRGEDCREPFSRWMHQECFPNIKKVLLKHQQQILSANPSFDRLLKRLSLANSFFQDQSTSEDIACVFLETDQLCVSDALIDFPVYESVEKRVKLFLRTKAESDESNKNFKDCLLVVLYALHYLSVSQENFNWVQGEHSSLLSNEFFVELTLSLGGWSGYLQLSRISQLKDQDLSFFKENPYCVYGLLSFARLFISTEKQSDHALIEVLQNKSFMEYTKAILREGIVYENLKKIIQTHQKLICQNYSNLGSFLPHLREIILILRAFEEEGISLDKEEIEWLLCNPTVQKSLQKGPQCSVREIILCAVIEEYFNFIEKVTRSQALAYYVYDTDEKGENILDYVIRNTQVKVLLWLVRCKELRLEERHIEAIQERATLSQIKAIQRLVKDYRFSLKRPSSREKMDRMARKALEQHRQGERFLSKAGNFSNISFYASDEDIVAFSSKSVSCDSPFIKSAKGERRTAMEDVHFSLTEERGGLFGVCDGYRGDSIAKYAAQIFQERFFHYLKKYENDVYKALKATAQHIRKDVATTMIEGKNCGKAGTTVVACFVDKVEGQAYILNVGNCSAFICRKNKQGQTKLIPGCYIRNWAEPDELYRLYRATQDVSFFENAIVHENSSNPYAKPIRHFGLTLSRSIETESCKTAIQSHIGVISSAEDIIKIPLKKDDLICLYTDGFSNFVSIEAWYKILQETENCNDEALALRMVKRSLANQGPLEGGDNVTVALLRITDEQQKQETEQPKQQKQPPNQTNGAQKALFELAFKAMKTGFS